MRREMRKLNRAKYAHSEEEAQRLISEGYSPVDSEPEAGGADGDGQTTDPEQGQNGVEDAGKAADPAEDQDGKSQAAGSDKQKGKRGASKK